MSDAHSLRFADLKSRGVSPNFRRLCRQVATATVMTLALFSGGPLLAQTAVTLDRIVELLELDIKEEKLLKLLKDQPTVFTLGDAELARLKQAGATERLLAAMQRTSSSVVEPAAGAYVVVLDASGSMLETMADGRSKWDAAKASAQELIANIPEGISFAVVVYGHDRQKPCGLDVVRALAPMSASDKSSLAHRIEQLQPVGKTPITNSLRAAAKQVQGYDGAAKILLITDGLETCNGNPADEAGQFAGAEDSRRSVDVIGFALADKESAAVSQIALKGRGKFFDAKTSKELAIAFDQARQEMLQKLKTTAGAVKTPASKNMHAPAKLDVGTYVEGRLAPNNSHYWQVNFPRGNYVVVYDVKRSDDRPGVIGTAAVGLVTNEEFAEDQHTLVSINDHRGRNVMRINVAEPMTRLIKVTNGPGMTALENYHLGVFGEDAEFGVPFLVNCPEVRGLELERETTSPLLGGAKEFYLDCEAFFRAKLPPGDFLLEVRWVGSEPDQFASLRSVMALDQYGVEQSTLVTGQPEKTAKVKLLSADDQEMLLRIRAAAKNEKVVVRITPLE